MPLVPSSTYSSAGIYREARSFIILLVIPGFLVYVLSRSRYYRAGVLLEALRFWAGIVVTMTLVPGDPVAFCFLLVPLALCAAMLNQMTTMLMAVFCLLTNIGMLIALPSDLMSNVLGAQVFLIFCIGLLLYLRPIKLLNENDEWPSIQYWPVIKNYSHHEQPLFTSMVASFGPMKASPNSSD